MRLIGVGVRRVCLCACSAQKDGDGEVGSIKGDDGEAGASRIDNKAIRILQQPHKLHPHCLLLQSSHLTPQ